MSKSIDASRFFIYGYKCKEFENLKFIDFGECLSLIYMPDISCIPNLEKLNLIKCKNLEHVHDSVANHRKLWMLDLTSCSKLQRFPDIPNKNKNLRGIYLGWTSIEELPTSIGNLVSLEKIDLNYCKKLTIIPSSIYKLQHLESMDLQGCSQLIKLPKEKEEDLSEPHTTMGFPKLKSLILTECLLPEVEFLENLSYFSSLHKLCLSGNNFTNLPTCEKLYNLKDLYVSDCQQLQEIPKIPEKLRRLEANGCKSLSRIPSNLQDAENVELYSCQEPVRSNFEKLSNSLHQLQKFRPQTKCQFVVLGGEMPKWLLPNKEGYISFVASKDLYEKILGVAFCVVFRGKGIFHYELLGVVNCKGRKRRISVRPYDLDHVLLGYMASKELWTIDHFSPNDSSHFHISIRVDYYRNNQGDTITVKKCGFRLMCKPLENDSEVLLQNNQLLDPALLYEVSHEDNPISTKEESSSETKSLQDENMIDFSIEKHRYSTLEPIFRNVRPGREMPKECVLVEDGTISFMASQDLYDKLIGLYICVVFGVEDGKKEVSFNIVPYINGQRRNELSRTLGPFDMDHVWCQLFTPHKLWGALEGAVDFGQFGESYLQFSLNIRVAGVTVKKLGYRIRSY
ncbi:hypothetical protein BT93_C0256 [Corymbia citriodora subsp. variegata]|nr:hypothetical protein BT93_C0256 [Corymbia citriodora subsp. variegata]